MAASAGDNDSGGCRRRQRRVPTTMGAEGIIFGLPASFTVSVGVVQFLDLIASGHYYRFSGVRFPPSHIRPLAFMFHSSRHRGRRARIILRPLKLTSRLRQIHRQLSNFLIPFIPDLSLWKAKVPKDSFFSIDSEG